jgi:ribonuclease-3
MDYTILTKKLNYPFTNASLLEKALTHRSVSSQNNERLEYLGDSIVNFVIAEALFKKFTHVSEGQLSRMRAYLVKKETLAIVAQQLGLGEFLHLGSGELKSGGFRRESILADSLEAIIAAIYLDSNLDTCREKILNWFAELLSEISPEISHKDPKTQLQEVLQAKHLDLPDYEIVKTEGKEHNQIFHVVCRIAGLNMEKIGKGSSRRRAEQSAAKQLLQELKND